MIVLVMAKRSKLAIEYNWPKKVFLHRFHDRVYRWLTADPWLIDRYHPYTPLHMPDHVFVDNEISNSVLLGSIFSHSLSAYVYANSISEVRTAIHIGSSI